MRRRMIQFARCPYKGYGGGGYDDRGYGGGGGYDGRY